jgi:predicted PhzF superfamily epimerase YddE/YHI9
VLRSADYFVVYESEDEVRELKPRMDLLGQVDLRGVIVTAPGAASDFVSRFFAPRLGIDEDPVTGSAHCALVPYWSARLGRKDLHAIQVSGRGESSTAGTMGARHHIGAGGHVHAGDHNHLTHPEALSGTALLCRTCSHEREEPWNR